MRRARRRCVVAPRRSTCDSCTGQTTSCRSSGCSSPLRAARRRRRLYRRAATHAAPLEHVGGLARVAIPATEIRADRRYVQLRSRLERRPGLEGVPVLSPTDLANLKPHVVVRTPEAFRLRLDDSCALPLRSVLDRARVPTDARHNRRSGGAAGRPAALRVGLMSLVALRDPLRDTMSFFASVSGIVAGLGLLVLASEVDLEASPLRRAVLGPLAVGGRARDAAAALRHRARERAARGCGCSGSSRRTSSGCSWCSRSPRTSPDAASSCASTRRSPRPSRPWLRHVTCPGGRTSGPRREPRHRGGVLLPPARPRSRAGALVRLPLACTASPRHRGVLVAGGLGLVLCAFGAAYWTGIPATVRQRVAIWVNPWSNGVPGGTRSRTASGRWRRARRGAAALDGEAARRAGGRHRLHHDDCRRGARVRRGRRCSSRCTPSCAGAAFAPPCARRATTPRCWRSASR